MLEVAAAHFVVRRIIAHEMTLKLFQNSVKALEMTLMLLDVTSYDFFDVENVRRGINDIFGVNICIPQYRLLTVEFQLINTDCV